MGILSIAFNRWWNSSKTLGPVNAGANIAVGLACAMCALADLRLGLGRFAPTFFSYFAVLSTGWGILALRIGADPSTARPLRLTGDILAWIALIGFTVLGLFAADTTETGPLVTLAIFIVVTTTVAAPGLWSEYRGGCTAKD